MYLQRKGDCSPVALRPRPARATKRPARLHNDLIEFSPPRFTARTDAAPDQAPRAEATKARATADQAPQTAPGRVPQTTQTNQATPDQAPDRTPGKAPPAGASATLRKVRGRPQPGAR
jgi:hypothetical protein